MIKKSLFNLCGLIALGLGLLGAVLPLLPTTPFILLAAFCAYRGSPEFHQWIEQHPWIGPQLQRWNEHKTISKKVQRIILAYLWISIGISVMFVVEQQWLQITMLAIATVVSLVLLRIKTI